VVGACVDGVNAPYVGFNGGAGVAGGDGGLMAGMVAVFGAGGESVQPESDFDEVEEPPEHGVLVGGCGPGVATIQPESPWVVPGTEVQPLDAGVVATSAVQPS